jgi:peptidoglycan-associated lipoprotein
MTRTKLALPVVLALVALAGCGHKRPPAVTTARPSSTPRPTTAPLDSDANASGEDLRALDGAGAVGKDLLSDANGEGGPLADIRFNYNEADLSDEARGTMDRHAQWIQAHPTIHVRVEGHCDERGTVDYNLALGDRRAQAARDYLVSKGVPASRLAAVSYGKERPLDTSHTEAAHVRNRRAHFAVLQ